MAKAKATSEITGKELTSGLSVEKQEELVSAFFECDFNITKACAKVGISRNSFYYTLRWNPAFQERIVWGEKFLGSIVTNGILEGLIDPNLTVRVKFLELLSKNGILAKLMGMESDKQEINLVFDKNSIQLK